MDVRRGACTARVHQLLGGHAWPYSKCMILPQGHLWPEPLNTMQHVAQGVGAFAFAHLLVAANIAVLKPYRCLASGNIFPDTASGQSV